MKVVHIKRFPFMGGFYAINLFGIIFTVQELNAAELNHERIHTAQQRELLYIGFYLWYMLEWALLARQILQRPQGILPHPL